MKRILYFLTFIAFVLVSCDPMEDINNELEEMDTGYNGTFTLELSTDDYALLAEAVVEDNPNDSMNAAFIEENEFFTDEVTADKYIPLLIPEIYPGLGLKSSGMITYNYSGTLPEDLTMYTGATGYKVADAEYRSPDNLLDSAKYFAPSYPPEVYIPGVLEAGVQSPASGDILLVEYMYSTVDPLIDTENSNAIVGLAPEKYKDYFSYSGTAWEKTEGVYHVNSADYNAMGSPGKYDDFSGSNKPADYIPNLLEGKFPLAGQDEEVIVVYKYNASSSLTLASTYTYNDGGWESSYDYVVAKTAQFLKGGSGWVFDPTISFTMGGSDYQLIVDAIAAGANSDLVDSYGTGESYYGAGAYYGNFDSRPTNYAADAFDSWEDCVVEAVGDVLLPAKFPNASVQVNGVDMFYIVEFNVYGPNAGDWSIKYQVTKSGPEPEFTLIEGPI